MRMLFDCTELSYYDENNGHRAGVFYVALNLFNELKRRGIDITFYCDFRRYYFMKNISEFKDIPIITSNSPQHRLIGRILYIAKDFSYIIRTLKNQIMMSMLSQILNIMYTESVREKEGGTYGVSADVYKRQDHYERSLYGGLGKSPPHVGSRRYRTG